VIYEAPAVGNRQPIAQPFVLGVIYTTPTWSDQPDDDDRSGS
jgi:hypothetical protein